MIPYFFGIVNIRTVPFLSQYFGNIYEKTTRRDDDILCYHLFSCFSKICKSLIIGHSEKGVVNWKGFWTKRRKVVVSYYDRTFRSNVCQNYNYIHKTYAVITTSFCIIFVFSFWQICKSLKLDTPKENSLFTKRGLYSIILYIFY